MGGCSSKPKTIECEGLMDVQEDLLKDEPARQSIETETISIDTGLKELDRGKERAVQNSLVEQKGQEDVQEKPIFYLNLKHSEQILEGIPKASDPGDRDVPSNDKEYERLRQEPPPAAPESEELVKEPNESQQLVKDLVDTPLIEETAPDEAGTLRNEKSGEEERALNFTEPPRSLKYGPEPSVESVFSDEQTSEIHEGYVGHGEETLELGSSPLEDTNSKREEDALEEMVKQSQEVQPQDLCQEEKRQKHQKISRDYDDNSTGSKECEQVCNGNGGNNKEEEDTEVIEKVTELVSEVKGTSEVNVEPACGQSGVVMVNKDEVSRNDKRAHVSAKGMRTSIYPKTTTVTAGLEDMEQFSCEHQPLATLTTIVAEGACPHEEAASLVEGASDGPLVEHEVSGEQSAGITVKQRALPVVSEDLFPVPVPDIQAVDTLLPKQAHSHVKDASLPATTKICEESDHIEVAKDDFDEVYYLDKSNIAVSPNEAELKMGRTLENVPQLEVSEKANGSTEHAFTSKHTQAEGIPACDMDEVLEKLASEFERQESLSHCPQ